MTEPHRYHPDWVIEGDRMPGVAGLDPHVKGPCRDCGQPELASVHRWQLRVRRPLTPEQVAAHAAEARALLNAAREETKNGRPPAVR